MAAAVEVYSAQEVQFPGNEHLRVKHIKINNLDKLSERRSCHLKHLLELNHVNYSVLYNNDRFHNHTAHFLGCAYLFGGSTEYLDSIFDDLVVRDNLESWKVSPGTITPENYRDHLGKGEYQRAWVDFFKEQIQSVDHHHDWQSVARRFLFDTGSDGSVNSAPMFHCLSADLGHPLIHLGYAFELNSPQVAVEALGLNASCYDTKLASLLVTKPDCKSQSPTPTPDLFEIFQRVYDDKSLPQFPNLGDENVECILDRQEYLNTILVHFNSWEAGDVTSQFSQAQHIAALILISTASQLGGHGYDFFLVHVLTTAHAVRMILPHLPSQHHFTLIREWLLVALLVYIAQNRPRLDTAFVKDFELQDVQDWEYVRQQAIAGEFSTDAHFVKACRAMHVAAETWNDDQNWFLKCAVRFVTGFEGWCGFNTEGEDAELARMHRLKDGIRVK